MSNENIENKTADAAVSPSQEHQEHQEVEIEYVSASESCPTCGASKSSESSSSQFGSSCCSGDHAGVPGGSSSENARETRAWDSLINTEACFCGFSGVFTNPEIKKLSKNWLPFLILGSVLMVLGFLSIGASFFVTILTVAIIGVLLMIGGIMQIVNSFYTGRWSGFLMHLALGILYLVVGFMLLDAPMLNAITLTFLLSVFFIVVGLFRMFGSLSTQFPGWGWSLFSGIVTFLLGVLIYKHWPSSGLWVIGLFVGIEMVFSGWYWLMFSASLREFIQFQKKNPTAESV